MKPLHVVTFQNPSPPDYGGVIDVYYKLKALHRTRVKVKLHTFVYGGRDDLAPLGSVADCVTGYKRMTGLLGLSSRMPYIVKSRRNLQLLADLMADDDPILFEGLHCCAFLDHPSLAHRLKIVRAHNVEHDYYRGLARVESNPLKKYYFNREARLLQRFEAKVMPHADLILAISPADRDYFAKAYPDVPCRLMPCFYDDSGTGGSSPLDVPYILYHGNLSVSENINAACTILSSVAGKHDLPFKVVIAGKNPPRQLVKAAAVNKSVLLLPNPSAEAMARLVAHADVNLLVTEQATGVKIKLLEALTKGKTVAVNRKMVEGSGLDGCCYVMPDVGDTKAQINDFLNRCTADPSFLTDVNRRLTPLPDIYRPDTAIKPLMEILC